MMYDDHSLGELIMEIIQQTTESGDVVINIIGDMDALGCKEIKPQIEEILNKLSSDSLTLNLFNVSFLDSSGIGAIVFMFKRLKSADKYFEIIGVNGQPKEILHLLRVDKAIPIKSMDVNLVKEHA